MATDELVQIAMRQSYCDGVRMAIKLIRRFQNEYTVQELLAVLEDTASQSPPLASGNPTTSETKSETA